MRRWLWPVGVGCVAACLWLLGPAERGEPIGPPARTDDVPWEPRSPGGTAEVRDATENDTTSTAATNDSSAALEPLPRGGPDAALLRLSLVDADGDEVDSWTEILLRDAAPRLRALEQSGPGARVLANLLPGPAELCVAADGHAEWRGELVLDPGDNDVTLAIPAARSVEVRIEPGPGQGLRGNPWSVCIADTPEPPLQLASAESWSAASPAGRWLAREAVEGERQEWSLGRYELYGPGPHFAVLHLGSTHIATRAIGPSDDEVAFVLSGAERARRKGRVTLRLIDGTTGEPLPGVELHLGAARARGGPRSREDGRVVLEGPPGPFRVSCAPADGESEDVLLWARAGTHVDFGDVPLGVPRRVTGEVVDERGERRRARVFWLPSVPPDAGDARSLLVSQTARSDGSFELRVGGSGKLWAREEQGLQRASRWLEVTLEPGGVREVQLVLRRTAPVAFSWGGERPRPRFVRTRARGGGWDDGGRLWSGPDSLIWRLPTDAYEAVFLDAYGAVLERVEFEVDGEPLLVCVRP